MESGFPATSRRARAGDVTLLSPHNPPFLLTRAQAGAMVRLIQSQLDALDEAASGIPRPTGREPFTVDDLRLLEPLVPWLENRAKN